MSSEGGKGHPPSQPDQPNQQYWNNIRMLMEYWNAMKMKYQIIITWLNSPSYRNSPSVEYVFSFICCYLLIV